MEPTRELSLTVRDLRVLRRTLKAYITKLEKTVAKSTFVPEPGRTDVTKSTLAHCYVLCDTLTQNLNSLRAEHEAIRKAQAGIGGGGPSSQPGT